MGDSPRVLGLDLSLTATGIALPHGALTTYATPHRGMPRLQAIRDVITTHIHSLDLVAIEGYAFGRPNQAAHLGELGGVIRLTLHEHGIPYADIPPASAKKYATGKGNATKPDMRMALFQRAGIDERDDNAVDAWWLRAMALDHLGHPPVKMPADHRTALAKVTWPEPTEAVA